ncbi:hypothetical protein DsansV1_C08g0080771 [Dioscorea sansibarensis]
MSTMNTTISLSCPTDTDSPCACPTTCEFGSNPSVRGTSRTYTAPNGARLEALTVVVFGLGNQHGGTVVSCESFLVEKMEVCDLLFA